MWSENPTDSRVPPPVAPKQIQHRELNQQYDVIERRKIDTRYNESTITTARACKGMAVSLPKILVAPLYILGMPLSVLVWSVSV